MKTSIEWLWCGWPESFLDDALDVLQSTEVGGRDRPTTFKHCFHLTVYTTANDWIGGEQVRDETDTVGRLQASDTRSQSFIDSSR